MWKSIVQPDRPQMTIWRMRIGHWKNKSIHTHSEHVILLVFQLRQWSQTNAFQCYIIRTLPALVDR